jgi:hypothetical protein
MWFQDLINNWSLADSVAVIGTVLALALVLVHTVWRSHRPDDWRDRNLGPWRVTDESGKRTWNSLRQILKMISTEPYGDLDDGRPAYSMFKAAFGRCQDGLYELVLEGIHPTSGKYLKYWLQGVPLEISGSRYDWPVINWGAWFAANPLEDTRWTSPDHSERAVKELYQLSEMGVLPLGPSEPQC